MAFGPTFIQPPQRIQFRNLPGEVDDPFGDRINEEVAAMNQQHRDDERFWREEHQ